MEVPGKKTTPPRWGITFMDWYLGNLSEDLVGDLQELFQRDIQKKGIWIAKFLFIYRVFFFSFSRTGKTRRKKQRLSENMNFNASLYGSYIRVSIRSLVRSRFFTLINIAGLALGMSAGLLVISMTNDLLKFDEFHVNKDRIYRVISKGAYYNYPVTERATVAEPVAGVLDQIPGVEKVVRVQKRFSGEVDSGEKIIPLRGYFADPGFLEIFSFPLISGSRSGTLEKPFSIVLTRNASIKLFNSTEVVGKVIKVGELGNYTITGVLEDIPKFSHMQFEMVGSFSSVPLLERDSLLYQTLNNWGDVNGSYVYILARRDASLTDIRETLNKTTSPFYQNIDYLTASFQFQALSGIVPGKDLSNSIGPKMIDLAIYIMGGLAFLILLSATFNYTHLSIARLLKKSREIGLRKAIGGSRKQLFIQFLSETILIALLSVLLSVGIFQIIKPHFIAIIPRASEMLELKITPGLMGLFILFALFAGTLAGIFPAVYFSSMNPVNALQKAISLGNRKFNYRKVLIVAQFTLSLFFIIGVFIISRQYHYSVSYDLGFQRENIIVVPLKGNEPQVVTGEFQKLSDVTSVSMTSFIPATGTTYGSWVRMHNSHDSLPVNYMAGDENLIPTLHLKLTAGRNFDETKPEPHSIIINESFVKQFRLESPGNSIDEIVSINGEDCRIIGVIKDFHYTHLEDPIRAFYIRNNPDQFQFAFIRIISPEVSRTMEDLKKQWDTFAPKQDFSASFLDEDLADTYEYYQNIMKIFGFIGFLAISIACLGMLGMAVYTADLRLKEISIRKIMGASESGLVGLLSKNFLIMMGVAIMIGVPMAYFFFNLVLLPLNYYHADVGLMEILYGISLMLGLGLLTIGSQTFKAARSNPVDILRNE